MAQLRALKFQHSFGFQLSSDDLGRIWPAAAQWMGLVR